MIINIWTYHPKRYISLIFFISLTLGITSCASLSFKGGFSSQETQKQADQRENIFQNIEQDETLKNYEQIAHPQILKAYNGEYKNQKLERTIAQIVGRLLNVKETTNQTYRIILLNSSSVNAFALPNGYVYITRGLLALALDSSEIAGVIAHEMAHIIAHHGLLRLKKEEEVNRNDYNETQFLKPENQKNLQQQEQLYLAQFTRLQELEADAIGIQILADAGYDPFAIARFLKRMENYSKFRNVSLKRVKNLDFLATHPATPQRIAAALQKAEQIVSQDTTERGQDRFLYGLDGLLYNAVHPKGFIRDHEFISPSLKISLKVPHDFSLLTLPQSVVASDAEQTALRFDIVPSKNPIDLLNYMQSGWIKGIDLISLKPIEINGFSGAYAQASNSTWRFSVIVLAIHQQLYRFLTASTDQATAKHLALYAAQHLRLLSDKEIKQLKPLYIRILRTKANDKVETLAQKMQGTDRKEELFRILNDLTQNQNLIENQLVKIIAE